MTMSLNIGIGLALVCSVFTQLAFLYRHRGANAAARVDARHPLRSGRELLRSRWFAIGMAVAVFAWLMHLAALFFAPLSIVQAVLSTGVVILAVLADRLFGLRVGRRQWIGVSMTAVGLLLLIVTLPATDGSHSRYDVAAMVAFESAMLAIGMLLINGRRIGAPDHHRGAMLGGAAGVLIGVSDVAVKALIGADSFGAVLVSPWLAVALAGSITAFFASARGMQQGDAVPVITSTSMAANLTCILGGIIVFGDPMPADPVGIVAQVVAFALVALAAFFTPPTLPAGHVTARAS
ncbi:MAG: hypothetical protein M3P40_09640 [Actinomycetota bacterium]|nr:hypothetical protein [Actinomycetota bacterium]